MECISCLAPKANELVFETDFWKITLSVDQAYLGRSYVTLKRHCGSISELSPTEWEDLRNVIKKLESALKSSFGADMFNWTCLMNLAYQNNPPNPHVHRHFRPRYRQPVELGEQTFTDDEFGHHYNSKRSHEINDVTLQLIRTKIVNSL